ncbi:MAG: flagellar export chaperone FliS [Dehalococcoidia bacterium]|nr:MAG: flagellar export chaperone FliS [Planctomycetaceae bacterium]RPJ56738.1 MAG: flagellar export chaperone FliS [Dehalococcoidia bacterium]
MKDGYTAYQTANIDTADQGKLILIAYDVAIKHCRLALEIFADRTKAEERTKHLFKVQDAVAELMGALRLDVGDIAKNLYRLYEYMNWRLVNAGIKQKPEHVQEVLGYLTDLRGAWKDAVESIKAQKKVSMDNGQPASIAVSG